MNDSPHPSRDTDFQYVAQILIPDALVGGRYRLVEPLGRGGYSIVWRARDEHLNMDVAIKFLSDLIVNNPEALSDLKRETRLSLQLTHPNIVRIYGFVQEQHVAGISMELVEGGTLAALKSANEARAFRTEELKPMMRPLFEALQYAHEVVEVVHRDLKPANLMVDSKGLLRIADFGISSSLNDTRTRDTAQVSGTIAYMSPEQIAGRPASVTDDVYSLGATLFDLLAGKPPFYQGNVIGQVVSVDPPSIQDRRMELGISLAPVPDVWEKTIRVCLEKDAAKRPGTIREVAEMLGIYDITDSRSGAAAAVDAGDAGKTRSRFSLVGIGGVVAAVLVAASLVVYFAGRDSGADSAQLSTSGNPAASTEVARKDVAPDPADRAQELSHTAETTAPSTGQENALASQGLTDSSASEGAGEDVEALSTALDDETAAQAAHDESPIGDVVASDARATDRSPTAGSSAQPPNANVLRSEIESLIAARQWDRAMEGIESLVDIAPGDIALAHQLTQKLSEAKEAETRELRAETLRTEIRALAELGSWVAAGDLIDELDAIAPGDAEVRAWKSARKAAREASLASVDPGSDEASASNVETSATSKEQNDASVRSLLGRYESALEALDATKYAALWVAMPGSERSKIERAFRDIEGQSIEINGTSISLEDKKATVKFQQKQTIKMKFGSDPPPIDRTRSMKLIQASDGRWLIDSIQ